MRENMRRNYALHSIEGGLYMGAMAFLAAETVMPAMVHSLGGPAWLVALMPVMIMLGFAWPPLISAHWVERQPRLKPFVITFGVFFRIPYLLAGVFLLLSDEAVGPGVIAIVALTPLISGTINGLGFGAWIEIVSRTVPPRCRASLSAVRNIIGASIGLAAGAIIHWLLELFPGVRGYGILHLITFGLMTLSLVTFMLVRETPWLDRSKEEHRTLASNLRSIPSLFRGDPQLRNFLFTRFFFASYFILIPFLPVHALQVTGANESFLGSVLIASVLGQLTGNVVGGFLGDKCGGKIVIRVAQVAFLALALGAAITTSTTGFLLIFFLSGMVFAMDIVGRTTLSIEICPENRRATYLSLINAVSLPSFLLAAGISFLIRENSSGMLVFAIVSSAAMLCSVLSLSRIREPRTAPMRISTKDAPCKQGRDVA